MVYGPTSISKGLNTMLSKTVGKGVLCAFLLALMTLATASAQTWWNPDYAMRIPVAITNNTGTATPTSRPPGSALP